MNIIEQRDDELIELGSVSTDTQGGDEIRVEGFTLEPKPGLSAE